MRRYIILSPTPALAVQRSASAVITIPRSAVVEVARAVEGRDGTVEVTFQGETMLMLKTDLAERGCPVEEADGSSGMVAPGLPPPMVERHRLENALRSDTERALERYRAAVARHTRLLEQRESDGHAPGDAELLEACEQEKTALEEYARTLRIFTDVVIHRRLPGETSDAA